MKCFERDEFSISGTVTKVSKLTMGSFRNVRIHGYGFLVAAGIGEGFSWPQVGDHIEVKGRWDEMGRFFSDGRWEHVEGGAQ